MPVDTDAVFQSYGRCCNQTRFFESFYQRFMSKSEEVRNIFLDTDMAEQYRLLRAGIMWLIMHSRGAPGGKLRHLGETHNRNGYNIQPHLYGYWLEALLETIEEHDPGCSAELLVQWREALNPGIDLIRNAY